MDFCPKCDNLLIIQHNKIGKAQLFCRDCEKSFTLSKKKEKGYILTESMEHDELSKTQFVNVPKDSKIPDEIREDLLETYRESIESFKY